MMSEAQKCCYKVQLTIDAVLSEELDQFRGTDFSSLLARGLDLNQILHFFRFSWDLLPPP